MHYNEPNAALRPSLPPHPPPTPHPSQEDVYWQNKIIIRLGGCWALSALKSDYGRKEIKKLNRRNSF